MHNIKAEKDGEVVLPESVFGVDLNTDLVYQVVRSQSLNRRQNSAHTKDRSEVSGGGRKPWRQKGTGRARHGSIRSPIWVGGGVAFGPNLRNWKRKINKKMNRKAICIMLSERNRQELVKFSEIDVKKEPKDIRKKVSEELTKRTLVVSDEEKLNLALRNINDVKVVKPTKLNLKDVVNARNMIIDMNALNILEERLTNGK